MNNYVQPGGALTVTMPDAKTKGAGVKVGTKLFGIAHETYTSGQVGVIWTEGVFDVAKTTGQAYAVGAAVWWDDTAGKVTSGTGANLEVGVVTVAAGSSDTTARIRLGAIPGVNT